MSLVGLKHYGLYSSVGLPSPSPLGHQFHRPPRNCNVPLALPIPLNKHHRHFMNAIEFFMIKFTPPCTAFHHKASPFQHW
jgi:hypothetical protein